MEPYSYSEVCLNWIENNLFYPHITWINLERLEEHQHLKKVPQGFESNPGTDMKVSLLSQKQKSANDLSNLMDVP